MRIRAFSDPVRTASFRSGLLTTTRAEAALAQWCYPDNGEGWDWDDDEE